MLQNPAYRLIYPDILDNLLRHLRKRLLVYLALAVASLTSCTTGRTSLPTPEKPGVDVQVSTDKISRAPSQVWQFDFDHRPHTYLSTTHVSIHTVDGTQSESDTLTSIVHFIITADRSQLAPVISGVVDRAQIITGNRIGMDSSRIEVPINFVGTPTGQRLELNLATPSDTHLAAGPLVCTNPGTAVLGDIRTLLITLPEGLTTGQKWTDTITSTTCNTAGISSTVHTVRSYDVIGDTIYTGLEVLIIQRRELTELIGRGAQGQHEVTLKGNGTGLTTIYLNKRGIPLATDTSGDLPLTITTSGRSRLFSQHFKQIIRLLN